jgi:hypothetical protein
MTRLRTRFFLTFITLIALATLAIPRLPAQESGEAQYYSTVRVARLSDVEGDVQFQRPGEDWVLAEFNLPLEQGFKLRTQDGRVEVQFESGGVMRLAQNTAVEFTELAIQNGSRVTRISVTTGTAMFSTALSRDDSFSVETPNLKGDVPHNGGGRFRVDVTEDGSWVTVLAGELQINSGESNTKLTAGHMLQLSAADPEKFNVDSSPELDDFDKWTVDRDHQIAQAYEAEQPYLNQYQPEVYSYGVEDLSSYGHWVSCSFGAMCWQPYGVPARWSPFSDGCWSFYGGFGWTWISAERWGWLPYHFGRWTFEPRIGWAWIPGPLNRFHPGQVRWLSVENKIAWAPAGVSGAAANGNLGVVTGSEERGRIRTHEHWNGVASNRATAVVATNASAPSAPRAATPRSLTIRNTPGIAFDPATRTFVNSNVQPQPAPVQNPAAAENRREAWRSQNPARNSPANGNSTSVAPKPVVQPPPVQSPATRQVPVEPGFMRARPMPPSGVNTDQRAISPHQVPTAPTHFGTPPQQHFGTPVQPQQHFAPPPIVAAPHVSPPPVVATPHVAAPPVPAAPHVSAPAPNSGASGRSGAGIPHH